MVDTTSILNLGSWGMHLNAMSYGSTLPGLPEWANPSQKETWRERGVIVWDEGARQIAWIHASKALTILKELRDSSMWRTDRYVVGTEAYEVSVPLKARKRRRAGPEQSEVSESKGRWTLTDQISLSPQQTAELLSFLSKEEGTLQQVAEHELKDRQRALGDLVEAVWRWKQKQDNPDQSKGPSDFAAETAEAVKIAPTPIPAGRYYSIEQVAACCERTRNEVLRWIENGELRATAGLGEVRIVELNDLNDFLERTGKPPIRI